MRAPVLNRGRLHRQTVMGIVCAGWMAGACSGDAPPAEDQGSMAEPADAPVAVETANDVDACQLLTAAEIEEVTGQAPGTPESKMLGSDVPACAWPSADGSDPSLVSLLVHFGAAPSTYEEYIEITHGSLDEKFADVLYRHIEGPGDFGVWVGDDRMGSLEVYQDDRMISVTAGSAGGRSAPETSTALAEKALARLQ